MFVAVGIRANQAVNDRVGLFVWVPDWQSLKVIPTTFYGGTRVRLELWRDRTPGANQFEKILAYAGNLVQLRHRMRGWADHGKPLTGLNVTIFLRGESMRAQYCNLILRQIQKNSATRFA
jgi:hypothetical protein